MSWKSLGLGTMLLIAACGGGGTGAGIPTHSAAPGIPFTMKAVNNSGVTGDGTITKMSGKFVVAVRLKGLAAKSSHMSHIHLGSCAAGPGDVAITLENVVADGNGDGRATTTISHPYVVPSTGWYVNVHVAPDLSKAE